MRISDWSSDVCSSDLIVYCPSLERKPLCDRSCFRIHLEIRGEARSCRASSLRPSSQPADKWIATGPAARLQLVLTAFQHGMGKPVPARGGDVPPRRRAGGMDGIAAEQTIECQPHDLPEGQRRHLEKEEREKGPHQEAANAPHPS